MLGTVLVTGGTGTFGQACVRRLLRDDLAESVRVMSRSESKQAEMRATVRDGRVRFLVGDIRDDRRVETAVRGCDTVIHAAALKRVDTGEEDPREFIRTNVYGTENVIWACLDRGVRRAVFLSTDKAASPNTLYGATKFAAERLWIRSNVYAAGLPTRFSATRYGNVLGSTGSVVPLWRSQADSGWITVTDPTMTRFWMRIEDSVDLVLLALREMRGGEVFVPKLRAASLARLAHAIAPRAAHTVTGARPGEKRHEELIGQDEAPYAHDCGTHYVIEPTWATWENREPLAYPRVPDGFTYRSDTAPTLSTEDLREMIV